jgi:hypothetical protein
MKFTFDASGNAGLPFRRKGLVLKGPVGETRQVPAAILTPTGREVMQIVAYDDDETMLRHIGEHVPADEVYLADMMKLTDTNFNYRNLIRIKP